MKDIIQFHTNGEQVNINSIPWMFTEQKSNVVKEFIHKIKFPTGFCSNMKNIITKKGDFAGVKTNDWRVHEGNYYGMHIIGNNVIETLWQLMEIRREKRKVVKACKDIQESNHAMKDIIQFHTNGEKVNINSIPWMFTEQQSNVDKELMGKIKFPTRFCVNLKNIITKKVILQGSKHMIGTSSSR